MAIRLLAIPHHAVVPGAAAKEPGAARFLYGELSSLEDHATCRFGQQEISE